MPTHVVIRALHDAGLAAWTGGSLMGAVGLNGAAASVDDPAERSRVSTAGWTRWAPVNAGAVGAHLIGATGLLVTDWSRVRSQEGVLRSSLVKTAATGAGLGVAVWSGVLNRKMANAVPVPVMGSTEPAANTPPEVVATLKQLKVVQWLNPAVGFALLAVTAWQDEQQRAAQELPGRLKTLLDSRSGPVPLAAGVVALGLLAAKRRTRAQGQDTVIDLTTEPATSRSATPAVGAPVGASTTTTGTAVTATDTDVPVTVVQPTSTTTR